MDAGLAPLPGPGHLPGLVAALERAMAEPERPLAELGRAASPADLHVAFLYELALLVRRGPAEPGETAAGPAELLGLAQRAAASGGVSWLTSVELRERLGRLAGEIVAAGAWHPERPLWWSPLPAATPAEELWARLEEGAAAMAAAEPWRIQPDLLGAEVLSEIATEIGEAHAAGRLPLEPGGIGATDRRAPQRSDEVAYLSGSEPAILAAAPRMAVLLQWLLGPLAARLAGSIADRDLRPPATAMLARYPAPSTGYRPHLDNPGGEADNGRAFSFILYLNPPGRECAGGELALWRPGTAVSDPPDALVPPRGGSAVLFASRAVPHQVLPLRPGPARWGLLLWLQDAAANSPGRSTPSIPELTVTEALQGVADPPLPPGVLLFHELGGEGGRLVVRRKGPAPQRIGLVATVYRCGAGLDAWVEHHLGLGIDHLVLVFDHLEEPAEAADAARLRGRFPPERLTIWSGAAVAAERWPGLPPFPEAERLREWASAGAASFAVASRQALNASAVLAAARRGELGGAPLTWLLHLDADEWLWLAGDARGGADLHDHFAAAAAAGLALLRYANHELLLPWRPGAPPRFKVNPRLAAARLGTGGWSALVAALEMAQTAARPYFTGYHNGKPAVAVARGLAAAGVHGWYLDEPRDDPGAPPEHGPMLAGPSVLHFHRPDPGAFRARYLPIAAAGWSGTRPFPPSPAEDAAVALLRSLEGADPDVVERELQALYRRLTTFTELEVELLAEAGLVLTPELPAAVALGSAAR